MHLHVSVVCDSHNIFFFLFFFSGFSHHLGSPEWYCISVFYFLLSNRPTSSTFSPPYLFCKSLSTWFSVFLSVSFMSLSSRCVSSLLLMYHLIDLQSEGVFVQRSITMFLLFLAVGASQCMRSILCSCFRIHAVKNKRATDPVTGRDNEDSEDIRIVWPIVGG